MLEKRHSIFHHCFLWLSGFLISYFTCGFRVKWCAWLRWLSFVLSAAFFTDSVLFLGTEVPCFVFCFLTYFTNIPCWSPSHSVILIESLSWLRLGEYRIKEEKQVSSKQGIHIWYLRRQWHPTPVHLPGKSHGWRSLEGCSPWGRWGSDTTEWLHFHFSLSCIGEGNGNPLPCSCLETPRDGGA